MSRAYCDHAAIFAVDTVQQTNAAIERQLRCLLFLPKVTLAQLCSKLLSSPQQKIL